MYQGVDAPSPPDCRRTPSRGLRVSCDNYRELSLCDYPCSESATRSSANFHAPESFIPDRWLEGSGCISAFFFSTHRNCIGPG
ncbi:hypothetical protein BDW59DRAFT_9664 [Aspergillus cavernicola]|uniref:Uncharacterized protein n=1 Tax=Aspergillus cavernicola TaxID=176166 RepID=A0ABR4HPG6_9EURO